MTDQYGMVGTVVRISDASIFDEALARVVGTPDTDEEVPDGHLKVVVRLVTNAGDGVEEELLVTPDDITERYC